VSLLPTAALTWFLTVVAGVVALIVGLGLSGRTVAGGERALLALWGIDALLALVGFVIVLRAALSAPGDGKWFVVAGFALLQGATAIMLAFTALIALNR
jgi:hypothetical protein